MYNRYENAFLSRAVTTEVDTFTHGADNVSEISIAEKISDAERETKTPIFHKYVKAKLDITAKGTQLTFAKSDDNYAIYKDYVLDKHCVVIDHLVPQQRRTDEQRQQKGVVDYKLFTQGRPAVRLVGLIAYLQKIATEKDDIELSDSAKKEAAEIRAQQLRDKILNWIMSDCTDPRAKVMGIDQMIDSVIMAIMTKVDNSYYVKKLLFTAFGDIIAERLESGVIESESSYCNYDDADEYYDEF